MKKIFSLFCTAIAAISVHAQSDSTLKFQYKQPFGLKQLKPLPPLEFQKIEVHGPSATPSNFVRPLANPMVFAYNNNKGFDVYESQIDKMPILKPDAKTQKILGMKPSVPTGK